MSKKHNGETCYYMLNDPELLVQAQTFKGDYDAHRARLTEFLMRHGALGFVRRDQQLIAIDGKPSNGWTRYGKTKHAMRRPLPGHPVGKRALTEMRQLDFPQPTQLFSTLLLTPDSHAGLHAYGGEFILSMISISSWVLALVNQKKLLPITEEQFKALRQAEADKQRRHFLEQQRKRDSDLEKLKTIPSQPQELSSSLKQVMAEPQIMTLPMIEQTLQNLTENQ